MCTHDHTGALQLPSSTTSELTLRPYDILHFAGHEMYDPANPTRSEWIFSGDSKITANELSRIGRLPKFVFSMRANPGK
jgi:hypothetical protein